MTRARTATLLAAIGASACSHSAAPTQPRVPTALQFVAQPQTVDAGVPVAIQVRAVDASGTVPTYAGMISIGIGANPGAATLQGLTTVAAVSGVATFDLAIDQTAAGYTLTASASGLPDVTSSSFDIQAGPSSMTVVAGNHQQGLTGYPVNLRPAVLVTEFHGNPVPGVAVTFTVGGSGSIGGGPVVTDANGIAQAGSWILGPPGTDTLIAVASGPSFPGNPAVITASSSSAGFPITIQPFGTPMSAAASTAFGHAATKWRSIIFRPLPGVSLASVTAGACAPGTPALSGSTQGVVIFAAVETIDGGGGILAEAGPCVTRSNGLAAVGVMIFDSVDIGGLVSGGTLNAVVEHEMGHVLGFGTAWGSCLALTSSPPGTINDTYFGCPKARAEFDSIGGGSYSGGNIVPVENCGTYPYVYPSCTTGTVNSHWRQVAFGNEIMVGFLPANPLLSVVTVASLEDIGYTVNYAGADSFPHTFTVSPVTAGPTVSLANDIWRGPRYVTTADGGIRAARRGAPK